MGEEVIDSLHKSVKVETKILVQIVVSLLVFALYVRLVEGRSIFYPLRGLGETPAAIDLFYEDVFLETPDQVTINGWYIKSPSADSTLLFLHGNAGNNSNRLEKIAIFHEMNLNVFIIDYRGYGLSKGKPSEEGVYTDALTAFEYLHKRRAIKSGKIIVYGESLGAAVAIELASRRPLGGLIVDSAFTSLPAIAKAKLPFIPAFLLKTKMDSLAKIPYLKIPKLIIHSSDDEIVPFFMGQKLYETASVPKTFLKISGSHNEGFFESRALYFEGIKKFLETNGLI